MPDKPSPGHLASPVLVSACLLGIPCRYDGNSKPSPRILASREMIPVSVCPEQLAGLPTPRPKAWLAGGDGRDVLSGRARVVAEDGRDLTDAFLRGAAITLDIALALGVRRAVLKEGSPSCGVASVTVDGEKRPGMGVAAALLESRGIEVSGDRGGS